LSVHDVLGWVEAILVPISVLWLILCLESPKRPARPAIVLALILGLTLAQPFGLVVSSEGERAPPRDSRSADPTGVHAARLFGVVPVMAFSVYRDENLCFPSCETTATASLEARSWAWLPVLVNSAEITELCVGGSGTPCWDPNARDEQQRSSLALADVDGTWWVTIRDRNPAGVGIEGAWELRPGIASWAGVVYWVVAGVLIAALVRTRRPVAASRPGRMRDGERRPDEGDAD
jgi:hypothetical protein